MKRIYQFLKSKLIEFKEKKMLKIVRKNALYAGIDADGDMVYYNGEKYYINLKTNECKYKGVI